MKPPENVADANPLFSTVTECVATADGSKSSNNRARVSKASG